MSLPANNAWSSRPSPEQIKVSNPAREQGFQVNIHCRVVVITLCEFEKK
jgi:hypothetical protein